MSASPPPPPTRHRKAPPLSAYPGLDILEDRVAWGGRFFAMQEVRFCYTRFDGTPSAELTWELLRRGTGVLILPYDAVADSVALIQEFRLPALAAGLDPIMTQCPAGLVETGDDPEAAGRRELAEEAGLVPRAMAPMGRFMLMQGGCDEVVSFFCADVDLAAPAAATHGLAAEGEDTRVLLLPAEEAFAMVADNRILNAPAALALMWLQINRARLRAEWAR